MTSISDFIKLSKYSGMREDLVQAGGGNSAFKLESDRMVIKASGYQLADISDDNGFAIVDSKVIKDAFLMCDNLSEMTEEESKNNDRCLYRGG